jgi:hypothetical protein
MQGDEAGALHTMPREVEDAISNEFLCFMMAEGYAMLGRGKDAIRALRAAIRLGFINYPSLTSGRTFLERLAADAGLEELIAAIKPRWESAVERERRDRESAADTLSAPRPLLQPPTEPTRSA